MKSTRVLLIDNALDHRLYRPTEHWRPWVPDRLDVVYAAGGERLPDPDAYTHTILTGCEGSILKRPPWAEAEAVWVRAAIAHGARLLGSCWGHQLIAYALGGTTCVRRASAPEFGWIRVEVDDNDGDWLPGPSFGSFSAHFDEVVAGGHPDWKVLAHSAGCAVQALRFADLPVWGLQAHPEIGSADGRAFLTDAIQRYPEHAVRFRQALESPLDDSQAVAELVKRFLLR